MNKNNLREAITASRALTRPIDTNFKRRKSKIQ